MAEVVGAVHRAVLPAGERERSNLHGMTVRGVVAVLLVSSIGLAGCGKDWLAEPEPPTEAELAAERAQERQQQLDDELESWRELDMDGYIVAPISEPIVDGWLTTSIDRLYFEFSSVCIDVTFESRAAVPVKVRGKRWGFKTPDNKTAQGSLRDGDEIQFADRRGEIILQPDQIRQTQICGRNLHAIENLTYPPPSGIYQIEHQPPVGFGQTHVWLAAT